MMASLAPCFDRVMVVDKIEGTLHVRLVSISVCGVGVGVEPEAIEGFGFALFLHVWCVVLMVVLVARVAMSNWYGN